MAVKGKGKEVETPSSSKRKASSSASASKRRRSGVLQFVDDAAHVAEDDDEEEDESGSDDDFDEFFEELAKEGEAPVSESKGKGKGFLPFLVKEEELSGDELEELIKERYGSKSGLKYACYEDELKDMAGPDPTKDPTIWRLKCGVGRERQVVFCFMQKYVEFHKRGNRLQIFSAFALDHVKGYVFVEADKASDVIEACKGFCNVYVNRINAVPASEVSHLLANRSKPSVLSEGSWVRLKSGNYKGDIAQVVSMDDSRRNVLIKLVPRIDFRAISQKFGGAISLKNASIPTARLINPRELEVFRPHIELRRDRQSGEMFEVLDGNMFKDGYLFKRVALNSLIYWGVQPTASERVKFSPPSMEAQEIDSEEWVSDLYDSRRKKKSRASSSADLKASTSEAVDDSAFGIHNLVLFGKKDFGVILGVEKDGLYKILTGDMEGVPVVTIKKQEIKKVCADKMFTALDRNKKTLSINDPVDVSEGPAEGKKGVVKHMFKGVLFIYGENETENGGLFCAKAVHCVNTKNSEEAPPQQMQSFSENLDEDAGPSFAPSSPGLFQSSCQPDSIRASGRRRPERESLFSIGQMLRIRKGPLKGYLCRVVRMYRNDITVKLDSLVKLLTVNAEYLTVPAMKGQADESGAAGSSDIFGVQGMEGGSSWDTGLPSFTSDTWQPFSSSTAPTSGNGVDKAGGDDDPWGSKVPSGTTPDAWNSEKPSDTCGNTSEGQAVRTNAQDGAWQSNDDSTWGSNSSQKNTAGDSVWNNEKGKDAVSDDPWGIAVSKGSEGNDTWCQVKNAASNEPNVNSINEDGWGTSKIEVESGGWKPSASSNWDAKGKGIANEDTSAWGDKATKSQDTWGGKSDAWDKSMEEVGGEGGWNNGGNKQKVIDNEDNSAWGDKVTRSQGTATWGGKSDAWGQSAKKDGGGEGCGWNSGGNASWDKPNSSTWNSGLDSGDKGNQPMDSWNAGGGFGGRGGRGNRGSGGSGRGGGRSGGGDCFKCGQSGHFSRECPSAGNSGSRGGGGNCFKCGESGHFARECPSADGGGSRGGGGGGGNCYKCGQSGHFSRECPSADGGGSRGGGSSGGNCYKCGESGHFARECPSAEAGGSRGGGSSGRDCFKCGKPGHFARECPNDGGGEGGTWKSDKSGKPGFHSSWSNDQAGSNSGKGWDNSHAEAEKKTDWVSSSWSKDISGKETTGGADSWNAPTPAPGELQRDDPWAGSGAPALSTHTTDAWKVISESKSKGHNSGDTNQQTQEHDDPWASNQQTQASSSKAEADAKDADPWSTKSIHDTGTKNQDDPWSTKTDERNAANDSGGWHTGESSKTQSVGWGKSGNDSDWSKPRVSLTSGNNDNNNDGSGWGRSSCSSEGGGRSRGRGRGWNFGDRNSSYEGGRGRNFGLRDDGNNGGRGGNWRGRGGGQYGGNRGDRGGRNGSDRSTWNGDGNKSFGGSSWNRDDNRPFGGSGGSSWSKDNDSKKSSDWGDGWGNTGEKEKGNSSNESLSFSAWNQGPTEKGSGWGNAGDEVKGKSVTGGSSGWGDGDEKEKGNSWNDVPSNTTLNPGSTEVGSGWGNAGPEEKRKSGGEGGGSGWGNIGGDKEKGNSWNDAPSSSLGNQGSTENWSGGGNAGEVEKGNSTDGGGSGWGNSGGQTDKGNSWDKPNGDGSGNWDKGGNGGNGGGW